MAKMFQTKSVHEPTQKGTSIGRKPITSTMNKARRRSFKARHAKNIAKGKMSAAYWANKVKW